MVGIVLMSHGEMANGVKNSCELFFGKEIPQFKAVCLLEGQTPEDYTAAVEKAIKEVDDGSGVIGFVDLFNGTPCNVSAMMMNEKFKIITGMNLVTVLELLGCRLSAESIDNIDIKALVATGQEGVKDLYSFLLEE